MADPQVELAEAVQELAGAAEAGVHRQGDEGAPVAASGCPRGGPSIPLTRRRRTRSSSITGEDLDNFKDKALGIYDEDLRLIFPAVSDGHRKLLAAQKLIQNNRRFLTRTIARWTGARESVVARSSRSFSNARVT